MLIEMEKFRKYEEQLSSCFIAMYLENTRSGAAGINGLAVSSPPVFQRWKDIKVMFHLWHPHGLMGIFMEPSTTAPPVVIHRTV